MSCTMVSASCRGIQYVRPVGGPVHASYMNIVGVGASCITLFVDPRSVGSSWVQDWSIHHGLSPCAPQQQLIPKSCHKMWHIVQ